MCVIRIGGEETEFLAITLLGRSHPGCTDYWDGNWLSAEVEIAASGFRGFVRGDLRSEELARFHQELTRLYQSLRGTAEFATIEHWLSIRVVGDINGHMVFHCEVRDEPGIGNTLRCALDFDQTFVGAMLVQLGRAVREFPVIGERGV